MPNFGPTFIGLTGTPEQIEQATRAYRVYSQKVPGKDGAPYLMDHSSIVYLLDRNGRFVTHFTHEAKAETIAAAVGKSLWVSKSLNYSRFVHRGIRVTSGPRSVQSAPHALLRVRIPAPARPARPALGQRVEQVVVQPLQPALPTPGSASRWRRAPRSWRG